MKALLASYASAPLAIKTRAPYVQPVGDRMAPNVRGAETASVAGANVTLQRMERVTMVHSASVTTTTVRSS